jgi:hypothetical protein
VIDGSCWFQKNQGPLPQGTYTLGDMFTYKGYPNSYGEYQLILCWKWFNDVFCSSAVPVILKQHVRTLGLLDSRRKLRQWQPLDWMHRDRVRGYSLQDQE